MDSGYPDPRVLLRQGYLRSEASSLHGTIRGRHETENSRLKNFRVLTQPFRHRLDLLRMCFHTIVSITEVPLSRNTLFEL